MAGSYFYAETSGYLGSTIREIGNRSGIMLPDFLGMRLAVFLAVFVPLLVLGLFVMGSWRPEVSGASSLMSHVAAPTALIASLMPQKSKSRRCMA